MCDQTEVAYLPGEVVWVKLRALWWPGLVEDYDKLPEEITCSLRKRPIATVKFFQEDSYEYVHKLDLIYHYNCSRKHEFIKKGLDLCRKKTADRPGTMDFFPADVVTAEELTNGDPNILQHKTFKPEEKPKYTSLFGSEKKKFGKKKGKEDSPLKDKAARRKKLTSKLQAMGWLSRGITANIIYPSPDTPRIVTHRRFLNKVRNPDAKSDYESRILEQKCEDEPCSSSNEKYHCVICGYVTRRLNVIVLHFNSTHSRQTKNIFTAPSVLKGGSLCNPLLKLKSESRKSDSGRIGFFSRKRKSTKKPEKVKQESDMDSSEEEVVKAPVKKEKGKRGRKRKIRPEEEEKEEVNENVIEPVKKPKVLDSLLADWEDGDQDDEELESSSRLRSEDEDNDDENDEDVESASVDNETIMSGKSSVAEDTSASKSKEVFEFDPDEDDSIDLDLTPNVKGFGRRIPRVIDSPKEKKQAKTEPKKFSKGKASKKKKEDVDDFESLLAETSMPSLPSLPKSKSGTIDADDDSKSDESNTKPVLKEQNEADNMKIGEEGSKNSNSEVDLAVGSKSPPQAQNAKGTAKVTVEKIPDLAVVSTEVNEADLDNQKHDSGPEKSSGSDHTYMGSTGRRRRRSLLPLEKNEESMDIMSMPVVMDDVVEESSPVSKEPMLPAIDGCKVHAPRRGRPPKRGRGGRGGSRSLKGRPPQDPKSTHHRRSKSPSPHLSSSKSPPPHQSPKSPSSHSSSMSPPPLPGPKSPPPSEWSPKNSPNRQSSKSPSAHGSKKHSSKSPVYSPHLSPAPKSPGPRSPAPKSPDPRSPAPKSPSSRSPAPKSPGPRSPTPKSPGPRSPAPLSPAAKSPGPKTPGPKSPEPRSPGMKSPGPKSPGPRSPEPELKSLGPKSPGPKSPGPKSPQPQAVQSCLKTPPQSPIKAVGNSELPSAKSPVKSVQVSAAQTVLLSPASPLKSTASKILTPSSPPPMKAIAGVKKVSTPGAVVVQSKPDLQPEACGLAKTLSLSPSSVAASSSGTVKTIKVAVSGSSGSSPMLVGKAGTPGSKVMIVRGGQKMLLPAEASQQFLSNIGSGKKIMVITKSSPGKLVLNSQQQKILASGGKITTSTGQVISKGSSVMSSVAKLLPSKASTSTAASSAGGVELSSEPPALVKTDGKKTYKIITSPQSPGNILLNTSGRQILLPVSSIAASGSGVTTTTGSKQFILPVGAKNMKFLNAVGGSGQKVILQMKSSPAKAGLTPTKTVQPIVPKTVQSISPKTAQPLSPKAVPSLTPKTIQPTTAKITPKMAQPITPKTSQPVKVTKIATMIQGVPQLTPIGSPKIGKTKPVRKSSALGKAPEVTTSSSSVAAVITPPKKNSGIIPNPNLKTIVPQVKPAKKISLAVKPTPAELPAVSSMPAGGVQVVAGSIPGLEQIQTIVPSVETSGAVGLATSTQQFITGLAEDGSQVMYLLDNSQLMGSLDGSGQPNLGNMIITMDNTGQPVLTSAASDFTFSTPSSGQQDILAEALANTQVLQPEAHGGDLGLDTSGLLSSHASTMYPPTLSHGVLETSLTLNQPIMTPLEDLSAVSSLQPPPATGAATTVDLPSTITVPDITISTSSYASLPIPSATIQSTVFSEAQNITTFSTSTADGSVFIEAPVAEGESFLTTDTVYEQTGEGASMPLLDG